MPTLTHEKLIKYLAITVTVVACAHRLSTVVANIANGLALLLTLYLWRQNKYSLNLSDEAKGYMKAYLVFMLLILPSVFIPDRPLEGLKEYFNFVGWRNGNILFVAIMAFIKRRDYLVNMLTALLLTTTVDCLLAAPQSLLNMGHGGRGWGLGGNPLYLSGILCMVLPVALVIVMEPAFEKRLKRAASCTLAAGIVGLIFNNSRSAWLTEVTVIPCTLFKYIRQQKKYLVIFALVVAGIAAFMAAKPVYMARIRTIPATYTNWSHDARGLMWKHAVSIIQDHPVAGVGLWRFTEVYLEARAKKIEAIKKQAEQEKAAAKKKAQQAKAAAKKPNQPQKAQRKPKLDMPKLDHAHNNFLQIAAETGLTGLAGFLFFCGYVLLTSFNNYRKYHNPCDKLIFIVFVSNIVLMGMFDVTFYMSPGMSFMIFLIAALLQMKTTTKIDISI